MALSRRRLLLNAAGCAVASRVMASEKAFLATADYERREVAGFTVRVSPQLLERKEHLDPAVALLDEKLKGIRARMQPKPFEWLTRVPFWMEWEAKPGGAAEFHPSAQWLRDNGYNPEKAGAVEINNARNFVAWTRRSQPEMVLHELAHAYHFGVLTNGHRGVRRAFEKAKSGGKYESVLDFRGEKRRHYALTNQMEYFAEATEAYFGRNDFQPFTRDELREFDPDGYELMEQVWGEVRPE